MLIDLQSIDENGKDYNFDELSDELVGAFNDLVGEAPFKVQLHVQPMGNTYLVNGSVHSEYSAVCSKCGYDVDLPLDNKINEIVVIEKERPRNTQVSQSQQNFDASSPAVTYVNSSTFDLREFLHEMMASGFSLYPKCTDETLCDSRQHKDVLIAAPEEKRGHPGFAALKDLKVSKH